MSSERKCPDSPRQPVALSFMRPAACKSLRPELLTHKGGRGARGRDAGASVSSLQSEGPLL